ncbi:hypothetical protein [Rhabdaerophilum calidifontis]|uniref:hypothetical protein n=1 Tax=Rhabdaerophilum calidifontis TaxID=2604328 RepID=UPI00140B4BF5|nr:hypothetical protein [Rhabdaerophilum calidifontis]
MRAPLLFALLALAAPAMAAEPWNIPHEKAVVLKGRVVDMLCQLKGDCPPGCGAGRRQLGILAADGKLRLVAKGNIDFAGAVRDLVGFCGREIEADGLLVENPAITLFFVQGIRTAPDQPFTPADAFLREWTARNGAAAEWFRADPEARRIIAADGPYGIRGLQPPPKP